MFKNVSVSAAVSCRSSVRSMQPPSTPFTWRFYQIQHPWVLHWSHQNPAPHLIYLDLQSSLISPPPPVLRLSRGIFLHCSWPDLPLNWWLLIGKDYCHISSSSSCCEHSHTHMSDSFKLNHFPSLCWLKLIRLLSLSVSWSYNGASWQSYSTAQPLNLKTSQKELMKKQPIV